MDDTEPCAGNGLRCTVHESSWLYRYGQPWTTCEHVGLAGRPHHHDPEGRRRDIGTIALVDPVAAVPCSCGDSDPDPYPPPDAGGLW